MFSPTIQQLTTTTTNHANNFNAINNVLIANDNFLKTQADNSTNEIDVLKDGLETSKDRVIVTDLASIGLSDTTMSQTDFDTNLRTIITELVRERARVLLIYLDVTSTPNLLLSMQAWLATTGDLVLRIETSRSINTPNRIELTNNTLRGDNTVRYAYYDNALGELRQYVDQAVVTQMELDISDLETKVITLGG